MDTLKKLEEQLNTIIVGKSKQIHLAITCLLANGHLLLEDLPGSGKTTLAKALAKLLGLDNKRVQFTSDLLPSDITGAMVYDVNTQHIAMQKGPIFTHILLADEINRASPKCQSALLEAMEERQVSIENETFALKAPFFVIATQNPLEQYGTFPLPESQLDRFLFSLSLGYMEEASEVQILTGNARQDLINELEAVISHDELLAIQKQVSAIHVAKPLAEYVQSLLHATRLSPAFVSGLSTRAGVSMIQAAKAYALLDGADAVLPEHIQAVFPSVATHRLKAKGEISANHNDLVTELLESVTLKL